ncbi:MAG: haloacid dehalogenase [Desulfobulbus propionicus]|nr:MAG: haloacid dehalogenase [Desulfobulbus propionicus]
MHVTSSEKKPKWQAVFFDFDGVIADSLPVKTKAFAEMFACYGEETVARVITYHLANGGIPRIDKLRYCYRELLQKEIAPQELDLLAEEFSEKVLEGVIAAEYIPGALACLNLLQKYEIPAFVVSGTPHEEIQVVTARKGLDRYFTEVHGSPRTKTSIVNELLRRHTLSAKHCLFIGDALADYTAAKNSGTRFLGISSRYTTIHFPEHVPVSATVRLDIES